ncbi:MAG: autotransporter esterase [Stenotrophomonas indicatrix]|uniref:autotransporter outer membrane beta-barrel domain-containing protein n=1 Tax=Stenotrophomonas indicatrix TaxID=2045451 RepID=UPI00243136F6|nr:autotransporter domain-containing protein [Stenotrophomonas indicatrix]MDF2483105.1 autotransporter esterase [Stenotrophomonas indicatrix]
MLLSKRPIRSLMAAAIALAALPAMAGESPFSRTVFIGDSLTDSGYFRPLLPADVRPVTGQSTTNPGWEWAQWVADYYGTNASPNGNGQTGDNYAVGGARVGTDFRNPQLGNVLVPSLKTQTANYLAANGGKADPRALYTVWGGANDLFQITNPAQAPAVIGSAVTDQIGIVTSLKQAGAEYVLVPNLPDIGSTPGFIDRGAAARVQGTALSNAYNSALYGGLKQAGIDFIPLDTYTLLREIIASPGMYGFSNVTGRACTVPSSLTCSPLAYVRPDAASTYLFADDVHPTTAAHQMLGQYAISILEGPRLQQVLSHSAQTIGRSRADQVSLHQAGRPADGMSWWGGVRGDMQRYDHADLYDGLAPAGLFGVDWARDGMVFGGFAGFGRLNADFGNSRGDFTQKDTTAGLFAGWYGDRIWVNGQVSYTWLSYDVNRKVQLGPATREHGGSPDGSNLTAALNAGYEFGTEGGFRHGPIASVIWQQVKIDGYTESADAGTLATALGYGKQDVDSTVGRIGWQARFDGGTVKPYVQVTYDHEFEDTKQASAWVQSLPDVGMYRVPGMDFDKNYATAILGARMELFGLQSNIGLSATTLQKRAQDATLFASFSGSF